MPKLSRIAIVLAALAGCALAGCERRASTVARRDPAPTIERHACAIPDDGIVTGEIILDDGCELSPTTDVFVAQSGKLRLRPGSTLIMRPFKVIRVSGALGVEGSDAKPATITTYAPKTYYAAVHWGGILLEGDQARLVLDHASIERGGMTNGTVTTTPPTTDGAIRILSPNAHASIVSSSIRFAHGPAVIVVDRGFRFDAFENDALGSDGEIALQIPAVTLASVGAGNVLGGQRVRTTGTLDATATWPSFDGAISPEKDLIIVGRKDAPTTLTLARGTTFGMEDNTAVVVGSHAGLVARGVRFGSSRPTAYQGAWIGLILRGSPHPTILEDSIVESAGGAPSNTPWQRSWDHHPAIDAADDPTLHVARTTFRQISGWVFETSSFDGCGSLAAPTSGNIAVGVLLCRDRGGAATAPAEVKSYLDRLVEALSEENKTLVGMN